MKQTNLIISPNSESQRDDEFTCPDNCYFTKKSGGCLAKDGVAFLQAGYILEGVSILANLPEECKWGFDYLIYRIEDIDGKYPEETPKVKFAMGLSLIADGADFGLSYKWIKDAADMGCTEAQDLLKHLKKK